MGGESEKRQIAIELNGEFIGLGDGLATMQTTLHEQDAIEPPSIMDREFSFTLHPTKKFMRRLRWAILKDDLASFFALLLPWRSGRRG